MLGSSDRFGSDERLRTRDWNSSNIVLVTLGNNHGARSFLVECQKAAPYSSGADLEFPGHLTQRLSFFMHALQGNVIDCESRTPQLLSLRLGPIEASTNPFEDSFSLEFGEEVEYSRDEFRRIPGRIQELLRVGSESNSVRSETTQMLTSLGNAILAKTIQAPYKDYIELMPRCGFHHRFELDATGFVV